MGLCRYPPLTNVVKPKSKYECMLLRCLENLLTQALSHCISSIKSSSDLDCLLTFYRSERQDLPKEAKVLFFTVKTLCAYKAVGLKLSRFYTPESGPIRAPSPTPSWLDPKTKEFALRMSRAMTTNASTLAMQSGLGPSRWAGEPHPGTSSLTCKSIYISTSLRTCSAPFSDQESAILFHHRR